MKNKIITFALFIPLFYGCGSTKKSSGNASEEQIKEWKSQGFIQGTVVYSDSPGDCQYTIKTVGDKSEYLDPVNLDETYKKDGKTIWFKYNGLRRQNRCQKARPVELTEVKTLNN